ncbi:hypothetical protein KDH83_13035 [Achromobacter sp. Marseille-Q0513]|uniref:hypothetical protein n=1 Tax=Achromobacter sp. Marseille-Q0513 TaxID=2829161 RepID=UPI001BA28A65|nr:hypothetical protein [Achromobacter sp. Marseille-Q0513]MBR8654219.1 hypothetical protein [Achromobacter sp. Marseille-Q0513]
MPSSIIKPLSLKEQAQEDLSHILKRRIGTKLGNGQCVRDFCQLIDLVVIGQLKVDFHSVHRRMLALVAARSLAICFVAQAMKDGQYSGFSRVDERPLGDVGGVLQQLLGLGHEGVRNWDTHSLHKAAFSGIPFNLNGVEAA